MAVFTFLQVRIMMNSNMEDRLGKRVTVMKWFACKMAGKMHLSVCEPMTTRELMGIFTGSWTLTDSIHIESNITSAE